MTFDLGEDLHPTRDTIGVHTLNKILTKMQRLQAKFEDFAVRKWVTYSPLLDIHDTDVTIGDPDDESTESLLEDAPTVYTRNPPAAGTVKAYDLIQTVYGSPSLELTNTKFGAAVDFGGTSYIEIDNHADLNPTDELTIAGWAYLDSNLPLADQYICRNGVVGTDDTWGVFRPLFLNVLRFFVYAGGTQRTVSVPITPDTWTHFVAKWKSPNITLRINDTTESTLATATGALGTAASNGLGIGAQSNGNNKLPDGTKLAHLSILHKEVSSAWITNHMSGLLDTSGSNEEITTYPFDKLFPQSDAYEGMFIG